jgi:HEAT repeat protein
MPRRSAAAALLLLALAAGARGQDDDDPMLRNRKLSEWAAMLREDKSPERRRAALLAVELIGPQRSPRVLPAILSALRDDPDERIREAAAAALGRLGERLYARAAEGEQVRFAGPRNDLIAALRTDKSGRVREAAALALGKVAAADAAPAVPALAAALRDAHPGARAAAADTLRRLGPEAKEAVPALQEALADRAGDKATRAQAALALGNVGEPAAPALPAVVAVLEDAGAPPEVRRACAETLGRLGPGADAAGKLGAALASRGADVELRRAAAGALDRFGPEARPALPALRQALKDDDRFVRSLALHAVGRLGPDLGPDRKAVLADLLGCLNDRVIEVRVAALETFRALGPEALGEEAPAVTARLEEAARDSHKAVSDAAREALKRLRPGS